MTQTKAEFISAYGHIFEHSPWIPDRAFTYGPFVNSAQLHQAFCKVLDAATMDEKLSLLRAHPELGAKVELTVSSTSEQVGAGLKSLNELEYQKFTALNAAYRGKFGFPFIICVRENTKHSILAAYENRLQNNIATEYATALAEIAKIAWLRLSDMQPA
jgi:2-oxo-4-hydroxy-4-carboxy-5-ureidoimidazoline decarboxylase